MEYDIIQLSDLGHTHALDSHYSNICMKSLLPSALTSLIEVAKLDPKNSWPDFGPI